MGRKASSRAKSADLSGARLGGAYRIVVRDPMGHTHVTTGEYREIVRDRRLVKTWVYEGPFHADRYPTLLTVDFRATGPRSTEITLRQDQLITQEDREGNREGWRWTVYGVSSGGWEDTLEDAERQFKDTYEAATSSGRLRP